MANNKPNSFCECSRPATVQRVNTVICERCNAIEQMHLNDLRYKPDMKDAPSTDWYRQARGLNFTL